MGSYFHNRDGNQSSIFWVKNRRSSTLFAVLNAGAQQQPTSNYGLGYGSGTVNGGSAYGLKNTYSRRLGGECMIVFAPSTLYLAVSTIVRLQRSRPGQSKIKTLMGLFSTF